ncbi:MAG: aminotransferase class I/II-fold pyridoxal phosphate-dependent enzyme, partial [Gammaproteobacteria bacterium]|nr:aminotransferase class I/II-fold pyridoxal phosphate-dependent enzyme [Gammaproteobacteria bacterium]
PTPCADAALAGLSADDELNQRVATLRSERQRLSAALANLPGVEQVLPSEANFVLVRASEPARLVAAAKDGGVLIRDFSWDPFTPGCLRITIGSAEQNDQLLAALAGQRNEAES